MRLFSVLLCAVSLSSCAAFRQERQQWQVSGTLNGQDLQLAIGGEASETSRAGPDPAQAAALAKAVAGAVVSQVPGVAQIKDLIATEMRPLQEPKGMSEGAIGGIATAVAGLGFAAVKHMEGRTLKAEAKTRQETLDWALASLPPEHAEKVLS